MTTFVDGQTVITASWLNTVDTALNTPCVISNLAAVSLLAEQASSIFINIYIGAVFTLPNPVKSLKYTVYAGNNCSIVAPSATFVGASAQSGSATLVLPSHGVVSFSCDGTSWEILSGFIDTPATFTSTISPYTGAITRTAQTKFDDWLSVKDFGAKGDGTTDDTAAFTAAYAATKAGGSIVIPQTASTYVVGTVSGTKNVIWRYSGDATTNTALLSLPGILVGGLNTSLGIYRGNALAADDSTLRVDRVANYTGGTNGFVSSGIRTNVTVSAGVTNYEWAITAAMTNNSTAADNGENVALYGQMKKESSGKSWASCFEARDESTASPAVGDCIGAEVTCVAYAATTDTNYQRVGIHAAGHAMSTSTTEWGRAFWASSDGYLRWRQVFSNAGPFSGAVFYNSGAGQASATDTAPTLIKDVGSSSRGIDLSSATYSTNEAIKLASGQAIVLDAGSVTTISQGSSAILIKGQPVYCEKGLSFNGTNSTTTTATAGSRTLPSAPAGFLSILIDGVTYKLPYYSA